ncbi:MAG: hypothetical protein OFPI_40910 [Osedax symbiont Rs2]|nr:MAG: hypothetical protein OFPI_40910 [Osedax symbiont Rs2]
MSLNIALPLLLTLTLFAAITQVASEEVSIDSELLQELSVIEGNLQAQQPEFSMFNKNSLHIEGITEAKQQADLSLSVVGRIAVLHVEEGQKVEKGQLLLNFDNAREMLERQLAELIWQDKTELQASEAQEKIAFSIYQNAQKLRSSGAISGEEFKQKKSQYFLLLSKRKQLEVTEQREQIAYELADEKVRQHSLIAPFSGVVTKIYHNVGESVQANYPLVHLLDSSVGIFVANVDENTARKMAISPSVTLLFSLGGQKISRSGQVSFVSPVVDSASNLVVSKTEFDNRDGKLKLGVSARIKLANN